jgi:hypothetical protein
MGKKMERIECFKPTNDDWYPNYPNDTVRVALMVNMDNKGEIWHRVCVWGADDCGMEMDFVGKENKILAVELYGKVISLPYVDRPILKKWGFVSA